MVEFVLAVGHDRLLQLLNLFRAKSLDFFCYLQSSWVKIKRLDINFKGKLDYILACLNIKCFQFNETYSRLNFLDLLSGLFNAFSLRVLITCK